MLGEILVKRYHSLKPVLVTQLAERSLPIPEGPGSNLPVSNFYKSRQQRKRYREWPMLRKKFIYFLAICDFTNGWPFLRRCLNYSRTRIVGKGGLWVMSFIYKYKTSTTYPLYETMQCFVLINKWRLWVQSTLPTIGLYPQSGYDQNSQHCWNTVAHSVSAVDCDTP